MFDFFKKKKNAEKKSSTSKSWLEYLGNLLNGDYFGEFLFKHIKVIIVAVFLLILRIANQYYCEKQLTEIDRLQDSLEMVKTIYMTVSKSEMSMHKSSQITQKAENLGLDITSNTTPPYLLEK